MMFPKAGKYLSNVVAMFRNVFGEDEDIVQIYNHKNISHILEDIIHEVLEGGR